MVFYKHIFGVLFISPSTCEIVIATGLRSLMCSISQRFNQLTTVLCATDIIIAKYLRLSFITYVLKHLKLLPAQSENTVF